MMKPKALLPLIALAITSFPAAARSDYTLELKNGRNIVVPSYREEAGVIKFSGFGGEIGISKDQIQAIRHTAAADRNSFNIQQATATKTVSASPARPAVRSASEGGKEGASNEAAQRAKEEREYQDKVRALTEQLKSARDQYSQAVRGTTGPQGNQLHTDEQLRAHNDDANSRYKNALHNPSQPEPVKLLVPSPFSSLPPKAESFSPAPFPAAQPGAPAYNDREREFSQLRERTTQIERQREQLINEMRQKGFNTGSLFVE
ncbi:MAG: hypothetical protein FJ145_04960 [Deltaproteobacteria bacterium]|nr:hypothetical protein [Deltaproteobacteria bacterium]